MNCVKLLENIQNKIERAMEGQEPENKESVENYFKSIYSPATLINDWYEKRVEKKPETESDIYISETMDRFRDFCHIGLPDRKHMFNNIFESYGLGQELLIDHHGFSYYENYATTYDLMYNHLTKGICGPYPRRYYKGKYKPETDLTRIYGNITEWGLRESLTTKLNQAEEIDNCIPITETTEEFVAYDPNEVKRLNDFPKFKKIKVTY